MTFDIDANGIVNVSAKDKATGKEQQIRIQASGGLSDDEIQQMVKDAELHAEEDKKRKELIEARNHGEGLAHATEKSLNEHGDKISDEEKKSIEEAISSLRASLAEEDLEAIQSKTQTLMQVSMKLGEAVYKASQSEAQSDVGSSASHASGSSEQPVEGEVVDADFEELKEDKKNKS